MDTKPMDDSEGEFADAPTCSTPCRKCGRKTVRVRRWISWCGSYTDYEYMCFGDSCDERWWVYSTGS